MWGVCLSVQAKMPVVFAMSVTFCMRKSNGELTLQPPFLKINHDQLPPRPLMKEGEERERGCSGNVHIQSLYY